MAKMTYKHHSIREARHIARHHLSAAEAALNMHTWPEEANEGREAILENLRSAKSGLVGFRASRDEQVEKLKSSRDKAQAAERAFLGNAALHSDDLTDQDKQLLAITGDSIRTARETLTSALALAKSRKFESTKAEAEAKAASAQNHEGDINSPV